MFEIQTPRLRLIPLSAEQLHQLIHFPEQLAAALELDHFPLKLNAAPSFLEEFWQVIPSHIIPQVIQNPNHWLWHTHWLIVLQSESRIVGGIGGSGLPIDGIVTIGYFVDADFEGKGICTEAVAAFVQWQFRQPLTRIIQAYTLADGYGSQRVLQKNGFQLVGPNDEGLCWQKMID